jgi:glutamate synthase (NADPH/NADH) small chain
MAKPTGFIEYQRQDPTKRPVNERIGDFDEFEIPLGLTELKQQAARCMDCGVPSCHFYGCPLQNLIPDWNDMIYQEQWRRALELLQETANFPEITGRICPAPCEAACTLAINQQPVTIRHIELQIVERGWQEGWIQPEPADQKSGKKVAVIGSGPAGLTAAQILSRMGHTVVVFEKSNRLGGLLRYGIPDYKLEKWIIDRRLEQLQAEGVVFETDVEAGVDLSTRYLQRGYDVILIATGSGIPRNLDIPGRNLRGIHFAMDFLAQQNHRNADDPIAEQTAITAKDKRVVVIGGGDTGADCVGTARRQGARQITQIEILLMPPTERMPANPWPLWPNILRSSSSHEEGCERLWSILTKKAEGVKGNVAKLHCVKLDWTKDKSPGFQEIPGSQFELDADLILLALGFTHVEHGPLVTELGLELTNRGDIKTNSKGMTSTDRVFAVGDCVTGASLVVRAMAEARRTARAIHRYLMNIG